jgi:hypothetical protein
LVGISDGVDTSTGIGQSVAELLGTIGAAEARNIQTELYLLQQTMLTQGKMERRTAFLTDTQLKR